MVVLKYPLATEKAVSQVDRNNTITYIVDFRATKTEIKKEFQTMFQVKVEKIRCVNTATNTKKAYIKVAKPFKASDVASKLKLV